MLSNTYASFYRKQPPAQRAYGPEGAYSYRELLVATSFCLDTPCIDLQNWRLSPDYCRSADECSPPGYC